VALFYFPFLLTYTFFPFFDTAETVDFTDLELIADFALIEDLALTDDACEQTDFLSSY
jgi:hypothetical protein